MTADESPITGDVVSRRNALLDLARLFLRLGTTAFGGPAAHIAMMEDEVVRRRAWLTRDDFLDLLGASNLIPGPNSTEMAIHIGYRRAGWAGLLVAGSCFILPAFGLVTILGWIYVHLGHLPQAAALLAGIKPVMIAVVLQALFGLARTAVKSVWLGFLAGSAVLASALRVSELVVLFVAGGIAMAARWAVAKRRQPIRSALLPLGAFKWGLVGSAKVVSFGLVPLFLVFVKVGSVLFGSGYVLLAYLRADLVERLHWLTDSQLIDAIAVGQVTPGPVFTTATFVGYVLGGFAGGAVATVGIFLPAFVFVALSAPIVPRLRRSALVGGFLDGVNVASLALMAVVTYFLARSAIVNYWTLALTLVSAVLLIRFRVNSVWLVFAGGSLGLLSTLY